LGFKILGFQNPSNITRILNFFPDFQGNLQRLFGWIREIYVEIFRDFVENFSDFRDLKNCTCGIISECLEIS
jgi:hypothetical protein